MLCNTKYCIIVLTVCGRLDWMSLGLNLNVGQFGVEGGWFIVAMAIAAIIVMFINHPSSTENEHPLKYLVKREG